jgi:hypothetical protein
MLRGLFLILVLIIPVWGQIPPCQVNFSETGNNTMFEIRFLTSCDLWQAPHLANPMMLMIWSHSPVWAFLISGLFEIVEVLFVVIARNYVVFIGVTAVGFENVSDIVLSDWLIQAGLGLALGWIFIQFFQSPAVFRGWYTDRGRFFWWVLVYLLIIVSQVPFALRVEVTGSRLGYPVGALITSTIQALVIALLIQNEPRMRQTWTGRTRESRMVFWVAFLTVYLSFTLVVQPDFFYGSAPQTWLLFGAWVLFFVAVALAQGRGPNMLKWFAFQQRYAKRKGAILDARRLTGNGEIRQ